MIPLINLCAALLVIATPWDNFSGTYKGTMDGGSIILTLTQSSGGAVSGTLAAHGAVIKLKGKATGKSITGVFFMDGEESPFKATLSGSSLAIDAEGDVHTLTRVGATVKPSIKPVTGNSAPTKPAATVIVNGSVVSKSTLSAISSKYGVQLPPGRYWYDKSCGAWGVEGSQTLGITKAGVDLGGPLKRNASRGDTSVFVNGRELPMADVIALQGMGVQVIQGRWRLDAQGNVRKEGSSAVVVNLYAISGGGRGGKGYVRATAGGYIGGDGKTSYFFDPGSGASVMVGN